MVSINNEARYNASDVSAQPIYANMTASNKSHYHFDPLKLISLHSNIGVRSENQIKSKWEIMMKSKIFIFISTEHRLASPFNIKIELSYK